MSGKFAVVETDINGIKELLGDSETSPNGSIIDRIYKLEKSSDGTNETISKIKKDFADNKELNELKEAYIDILLNIQIKISQYETDITSYYEDYIITEEEKSYIANAQNDINSFIVKNDEYLNRLTTILEKSNQTYVAIKLNDTNTDFKNALTLLNDTINTEISDNTVSLDDVTIVLNMFGSLNAKFNIYKNTVDENIILGIGGTLTEQITNIKKTSEGIKQSVGEVVKEIDGEDGLKRKVEKNETNILQTAKNLELNYVKNDKILAAISLSEEGIKLDASKILATGTLTWDILDDEAKENLKGESGTAEYIMLIGEQIFKYRDLKELPSPLTINLSAVTSNINTIDSVVWEYKNTSGTWTRIETSATNQLSLSINHNDSYWSNRDTLTIRCTVNDNFKDEMTLVKLYDGIKGSDGLDGLDGSDGQNAQYVTLNGGQIFTYSNESSIPNPSTIKLTLSKYNIYTSNVVWYYKTSDSDSWKEITSARGKMEYIVDPSNTTLFPNNNKTVNIKSEIDGFYDEISIGKIYDGSDGFDAYYVNLTNSSHTVPCNNKGEYLDGELEKAKTEIFAYKGTESVPFEVFKVDNGCTSSYNPTTKVLKITSLTENTATVDLTITVEGNQFKKVMTITKSLQGANGQDGMGIQIINSFESESELPSVGQRGDGYIVNGNLYVWVDAISSWKDIGRFKGEQGEAGADGKTMYLHIKYSDDGETFTANEGKTLGSWLGQYTDFNPKDSTVFSDYNWSKIKGEDAYTIYLTNENHSFPCESDGTITSDIIATTNVAVYRGLSEVPFTIGDFPTFNGLAFSKNENTITITALQGKSLAQCGSVEFSIIVEGKTFKKSFSWSKSFKGESTEASIPDWIKEWDTNVTLINKTKVVSPKIFAGSVSQGLPTGVALGKNVFGTEGNLGNVNGLVGYKSGKKMYSFDESGNLLIGDKNSNHLSFDGTTFEVVASNIKIGTSPVTTESSLSNAIDTLEKDLMGQIDGKIQTYSQTADPKASWTSDEYSKHIGDIWYNGQYTYRWNGSSWQKLEDKDAINANNLASKKAQVFTSTPTIPYYKGDLWITNLSGSGVVKTCKTTRTSGSYTSSDWIEGLKYTDDSKIDNLQIGITNLLRYTDFSKSKNIEKWNAYNSTIEQSIYEGFGSNSTKDEFIKGERILSVDMDIAKMISSNATYGSIRATTITLEPNTTYTVSYWAFPTNKLTKLNCNIFNGDASVKYCKTEDIVYNGSFQFVKKTFKTGSDPNCSVRFYGYRDTSLTSGIISFYLYHPKIEKGDKATEWNENPNDSFENLSDLETALNNKIEGVKGNIEVTDDGIKISINGTNVTVPSHGELETVVTNFNNYITNTANGDFEMVFDKKIAEYDMDGMQTTTKNVKDHILFSNDGSIKLFGSEDKFSLNIGRTKLSFMDGDTEVAYISNQKLLIEDAEVKSSLKIGSFAWVPRENGNTSFTFVG